MPIATGTTSGFRPLRRSAPPTSITPMHRAKATIATNSHGTHSSPTATAANKDTPTPMAAGRLRPAFGVGFSS